MKSRSKAAISLPRTQKGRNNNQEIMTALFIDTTFRNLTCNTVFMYMYLCQKQNNQSQVNSVHSFYFKVNLYHAGIAKYKNNFFHIGIVWSYSICLNKRAPNSSVYLAISHKHLNRCTSNFKHLRYSGLYTFNFRHTRIWVFFWHVYLVNYGIYTESGMSRFPRTF